MTMNNDVVKLLVLVILVAALTAQSVIAQVLVLGFDEATDHDGDGDIMNGSLIRRQTQALVQDDISNIKKSSPSDIQIIGGSKNQCLEEITPEELFERFGLAGDCVDNAHSMLEVIEKFQTDGNPIPIHDYPFLFVGSAGAAFNIKALLANGITHIINASPSVPNKYPELFEYLQIKVHDESDAKNDISVYWAQTNAYIEDARRNGGTVMVNCWQGRSRSVSTILAYLVVFGKMQVDDALKLVRETRKEADPNVSYMNKLYDLEKQQQKHPSSSSGGESDSDDSGV